MSDSPLPLNSGQHQTSSPDRASKSSGEIPDREQVISLSPNVDGENRTFPQMPKPKDMEPKPSNHHGSSRIHELLNSFKEDVIQLKETGPQSSSARTHHHAFNPPEDYNRQFTRVSPQNLSATTATRDKAKSKWKQAVTMSRSVIARRRETLASGPRRPPRSRSFSADFSFNDDIEANLKMNVLLNVFNHASCIGSGILSGLLLWDAIWVYQHGQDWQPSEKSLLFFYTVTTVLTYICLIGYKLRLYTFCNRFALSSIGHGIIILTILVLHYVHKSYDFKSIECRSYTVGSKEALELHCLTGKYTNVLIVLSKMTQTLSAFFLAVYFHFAPYVSLELLLRSSQSQIKSIHLLSHARDFA